MSEWIPSNPYAADDQEVEGATLGDVAKAGVAGALETGAQGASLGQYGAARAGSTPTSTFFRGASELFHTGAEAIQDSETEGGKRAAGAKWLPEEGEASVTEAPFSSFAMKGANMAPYLFVLSAFPTSAIGLALAGGGMQMAQHVDAALTQTNKLTDDDLQKQSPVYADLRSRMDEDQARAELTKIQVNGKDLLAAGVIGAVANGAAARALRGTGAGSSVVKSTLGGAAEGGLGMAAGAAEADYGGQQSQVNIGSQQSVNLHHVVMTGLEAMADGGLLGVGAGAFHGMGKSAETPETVSTGTARPSSVTGEVQTAPELGPDKTQAAALPTEPMPAPKAPEVPAPAQDLPPQVTPPAPAPVKAEAPAPAQVANDAGQNIPEAPATLHAQEQAVAEGRKKAVLYPEGTEAPPLPKGMKAAEIKEGVVHYDPKQVKKPAVVLASKQGKLNELLDLGPANKEEVAARVQQGEAPVAVVERLPDGTEAKSAIGTSDGKGGGTAPEQAAALEKTKLAPENTVAVEPPDRVLQERQAAHEAPIEAPVVEPVHAETAESVAAPLPPAEPVVAPAVREPAPERLAGSEGAEAPAEGKRAPRILEDVTPEGKAVTKEALLKSRAQTQANLKAMEKAEKGPQAGHRTKAEKQETAESAAKAKELFGEHATDQLFHISDQPGLDKFQARLQSIMDKASERGINVKSKVGYEGTADHIVWLADVRRVLNILKQRRGSMKDRAQDANTLIIREAAARDGDFETMRYERKAEGDQAKRRDQGNVEAMGSEPAAASNGAGVEAAHGTKVSKFNRGARIEDATEKRVVRGKGGEEIEVEGAKAASPVRTLSKEERDAIAAKYGAAPKTEENKPVFMRRPEGDALTAPNGSRVVPRETQTVDKLLGAMDFREHGKTLAGGRVAGLFAPLIAKRVRELVGDVQVHFVDSAEMRTLTEGAVKPEETASGFYLPHKNYIVINDDHISSISAARHLILHESLHAALYHALERNAMFKRAVRDLMGEFLNSDPLPMRVSEADSREFSARKHYAFTDEHEFLSEAMSNPVLARALATFKISDALAKRLNLAEMRERSGWYGRIASGWDALVASARRALNLPQRGHTALEAAMSVGERLMQDHPNHPDRAFKPFPGERAGEIAGEGARPAFMRRRVERAADDIQERAKVGVAGVWRHTMDKLATLGMLSRNARELFGPTDPMRRVYELRRSEAVEKQQILEKHGGADLTNRAATLERKYRKADPAAWDRMVSLAYNATLHDVDLWGDNKHFGKNKKKYWQALALEPELKAEMRRLPPDLQSFLHDAATFYRDQQNLISLNQIKTLLKDAGVDEPGLAERIHADGLTDEDRARFAGDDPAGELVKQLDKARELKKINGSYFPLRRYGEHIVSATHGIEVPENAIQVAPDTIQFTSKGNKAAMEREAKAFVQGTDLRQNGEPRMVWVDKNDPTKILEAEDVDAIPAIRVRLHNKEVHFAEGELAARRIEADLRTRDGFEVNGIRLKDDNPYAAHATMMSSEMGRIVDKLKKRLAAEREKDTPDALEVAKLTGAIDSLYQSTVAMRAGNRIQSTMLPRRNIAGFSKDFTRTLAEYSDMAAGYLARLEHRPDVEAGLKEAYDFKEAHRHEATEKTLRRDELYREIQKRVYGDDRYEHGPVATATQRLLQMSMLDKLGGVSYHIINALEPAMSSAPYIGGRHGFANAYGKLMQAYNLIGGRGAVMAGLRDTGKAFKADHGFTDYVDFFKRHIAETDPANARALGELLDRLHGRGLLDKEAEFEVRFHAHPEASVFGRALDKADLIARQMGVAVESMNRAATGIAAYLAEREKGADHAKAMDYAFDVVHDTMGDYSRVNAPPAFNHPLGRIALQFKKYGQKQYYLLGKMLGGAVAGDKEARKQLAGVLFTHAVMAGALGLPLEPIKAGVMASNVLAGTQFTWDDFEQEARRIARAYLGETGGMIATRGLPRALGVDLSSRVGQADLLTHGTPRSTKRNDLYAWLGETIGGAPAGEALQVVDALRAAVNGRWGEASQGIPIKAVHDVVAAVQGATKGKETARGYEAQKPYSLREAATRAIGFKPAREAETSELRSANYHQSVRQKADHDAFVLRWMQAKPSERGKLWGEVEKWNKGRPREAQLTRSKLDAAARQRATKVKTGAISHGQQVNKYNRYIIEQNADTYAE